MWGIFFGEFQCLPVDDCPAAGCDSGVLTRGSESMSFYSAILVQVAPLDDFLNKTARYSPPMFGPIISMAFRKNILT